MLTDEQRFEKAIQHCVVFTRYMAQEEVRKYVEPWEVAVAVAARMFRASRPETGPMAWEAEQFAQIMRAAIRED